MDCSCLYLSTWLISNIDDLVAVNMPVLSQLLRYPIITL
ncbi:hypothetical protein M917_0666 [Psychrobacter aquaticus CMS 56]|uniref:Uncharacterized protein n=1 Tax=Psychrobacter aquaticus CMS 56 TaxID=1354303 RepID=U4TD41_9GAMM|nr:hypothetical protein M917_0666 [Psychrobacter aquaticus CMS 56]